MTQRLEQAISEVRKLPESAQDSIATLILEQITDDRAWDESFARSQDQLARLAEKARTEVAARRVRRPSPQQP
jgi:hypothetical protein